MHRLAAAPACALAVLVASTVPVRADSAPRPEVRAVYGPDGELVRLTRSFGRAQGATLRVGDAAPVSLHEGEVAGTLVAGHGRVIAALATDAGDAFRILVVDGDAAPAPIAIARPGARAGIPFAVAATATPDGFTVFFQEIEEDDPTAAHTYMASLDRDGAPTGPAGEVAVPWSLAAAAWNGAGYHLALIYASGQGMRLSMVTLDAAGKPQQHPDWASRPGYVADVHLVVRDGKVRAFYRGGGGNRLHERDVTEVRQWGTDPPKARDHGALPVTKAIAIDARGKPTRVADRIGR